MRNFEAGNGLKSGKDKRYRQREADPAEDLHARELLRRIAGEDREALTELYQAYHARLFKFLFRLTRSHAAADELVNDIMLVAWQGAADFRGDSRVSTWLFGIAYRKAMRHLQKRRLRPLADETGSEATVDDSARAETEDWVRFGLERLPAAQQTTVILVFYLGLSYAEVAEVTDCPVNTVKTRMYHARRKLQEQLTASAGGRTPEKDDE